MDFKPSILHEIIQIKEDDVQFESQCDQFSYEQNSNIKHNPFKTVEFVEIQNVKIEEIDEYDTGEDPIKINEDQQREIVVLETDTKAECFLEAAIELVASPSDNEVTDQEFKIEFEEANMKKECFPDEAAATECLASACDSQGTFTCNYCKKSFTTSVHCQKHIRRCRDRVYNQPSTSATSISDKKPRLTNDREKLFQCKECDNKYKALNGLNLHLRRHRRAGLRTCRECHKQFISPSQLAIHLLIHTGEKPHKCTQCQAAFNQANTLKTHLLTHTGARPHRCTQCGQSFTKSCNLTIHKRTHSGETPYQCTQCSKAFTASNNLTKHKRIHTGEKPFQCTVCSRAFAHSNSLKYHMKTHSKNTSNKP